MNANAVRPCGPGTGKDRGGGPLLTEVTEQARRWLSAPARQVRQPWTPADFAIGPSTAASRMDNAWYTGVAGPHRGIGELLPNNGVSDTSPGIAIEYSDTAPRQTPRSGTYL